MTRLFADINMLKDFIQIDIVQPVTHSPLSLIQLKNVHSLSLIQNNIKITSVVNVSALLGHL
jgi:hypothetical protein